MDKLLEGKNDVLEESREGQTISRQREEIEYMCKAVDEVSRKYASRVVKEADRNYSELNMNNSYRDIRIDDSSTRIASRRVRVHPPKDLDFDDEEGDCSGLKMLILKQKLSIESNRKAGRQQWTSGGSDAVSSGSGRTGTVIEGYPNRLVGAGKYERPQANGTDLANVLISVAEPSTQTKTATEARKMTTDAQARSRKSRGLIPANSPSARTKRVAAGMQHRRHEWLGNMLQCQVRGCKYLNHHGDVSVKERHIWRREKDLQKSITCERWDAQESKPAIRKERRCIG